MPIHQISVATSDRCAAIEALRESEQRYRRIVENTTEGVWTYDANGITTFMNSRMAEMLGCTVEETIGQPIHTYMKAPRMQVHDRTQRHQHGIPERSELELCRKDGATLAVSINASPLFDADGKFEAALSLVTDVSPIRRADDTRAHLAAIVQSSEDAIVSASLDGTITSWNDGAERLYQFSATEMIGRSMFTLIPAEQIEFERDILRRVTAGESMWQHECEHVRKDGTSIAVAITASPVRDVDGAVIGMSKIARDLTARHAAEEAHRRVEEQFRQMQKMEAVGRLAGGVAHDFNNLLTVILSYTEFGIEELKGGDPLRDDLMQIKRAAERAAALTTQLLVFSRQQVLQPRVVDLNKIVVGMQGMLGRLLGEDVELTVLGGQALGRVLADPGQIEQVVMNLAVNARDAMPEGGKLSIETTNIGLDAHYVGGFSGVPPGDYVMLAVSDTGIGMDPATSARIFEPFFTTKTVGKGTGLGLSTVFGIVQQSGGYLGVYTELGHGTTFKAYLPRTDRPVEPSHDPGRIPVLHGDETILLVEDEEQVRTVACAILRRSGYHVLETSNGGEAFLVANDHAGTIHLLLTDVVMPRLGGRRLVEHLAPSRPEMRVLFASGYTDDAVVHHGVLAVDVAFIQKPFTPDTLLRKVREVLDAGRALPD